MDKNLHKKAYIQPEVDVLRMDTKQHYLILLSLQNEEDGDQMINEDYDLEDEDDSSIFGNNPWKN